MYKLFFIASLFFIYSCKSKKMDNTDVSIKDSKNSIIKKISSPDKTKNLVLNFENDLNTQKEFNYKVVAINSNKILSKGIFTGTKMNWKDNNNIIGYFYIGMVPENETLSDSDKFKIIQIPTK